VAAQILPKASRAGRIADLYAMFPDLMRLKALRGGQLSGGQRQMLAVARALIVEPSVLILDEPSAGLAPKIVKEVFANLKAVNATGVTTVLVEQNVKAALAIADRAIVLVEGQVRLEGDAHSLGDDAVMAEEVQGVRAFGQESAVEMVMGRVAERMMTSRSSLEVTKEYARVGAVIGVITYAGGKTENLFTLFGVSQDTELAFDLGTRKDGVLRAFCAGVIRQMSKNLAGIPFTGIHAICGDAFFDDLLKNPEIRDTFLNNPAAAQLRATYIQTNQS
jgi:ABC-type proline/glycine betaine transport system ATPase subunit